jgi:hypothetical protein
MCLLRGPAGRASLSREYEFRRLDGCALFVVYAAMKPRRKYIHSPTLRILRGGLQEGLRNIKYAVILYVSSILPVGASKTALLLCVVISEHRGIASIPHMSLTNRFV